MANPFTRAKPPGWAFGEILTSAQMNALDIDHAAAAATTHCDAEQNRTGVQVPFGSGFPETSGTGWRLTSNWLVESTATGLRWAIDVTGLLPHGVTITQVEGVINGNAFAGSAHVGLPATMPNILFSEVSSSGTVNYSVNVTDGSASVGNYEVDHPVDLTVSRTVSRLLHYWIYITGENGANALNAYFALKGLSISWTAP